MGEETCYPLAFGVPAIFMVLATIAFLIASKWYVKIPPLGNPIIDVAKVTWVIRISDIFFLEILNQTIFVQIFSTVLAVNGFKIF